MIRSTGAGEPFCTSCSMTSLPQQGSDMLDVKINHCLEKIKVYDPVSSASFLIDLLLVSIALHMANRQVDFHGCIYYVSHYRYEHALHVPVAFYPGRCGFLAYFQDVRYVRCASWCTPGAIVCACDCSGTPYIVSRPNCLILFNRLRRDIPRALAALVRFPLCSLRACIIASLSSWDVVVRTVSFKLPSCDLFWDSNGNPRSAGWMFAPDAMATALAMTFSSSRIFPGQAYAMSEAMASFDSVLAGRLSFWQ